MNVFYFVLLTLFSSAFFSEVSFPLNLQDFLKESSDQRVNVKKEDSKKRIDKKNKEEKEIQKATEAAKDLLNIFKAKDLKKDQKKEACTKKVDITDVIGPITLETVERAFALAKKDGCSSIIFLINTPGGMLLTTRKIVEAILDSEIPVLCLIYPQGAHAGSAGAIIMQACHVNGAVEATNIGAATPIISSGKDAPKDLRKKMVNDTTSWLDSLTDLRKRNKEFGRKIVTEAQALSGKDAHKIGAIDFYGQSLEEFMDFARGRKVQIKDKKNVPVKVGKIQTISLGIRHSFIGFITDPQIVYLLFAGSLLLIYFEITHPGTIAPGVLGAVGLIISFIGMHKLNFVWGGLLLILLGVLLLTAEVFVSGFGILGGAGAISFIIGSFFLFDPSKTGGAVIPTSTIIITSVIFFALAMGLAYMAYTSLRKRKDDKHHEWIHQKAKVVEIQSDFEGLIEIHGEIWKYRSDQVLEKGDTVKIVCYTNMLFEVTKDTDQK